MKSNPNVQPLAQDFVVAAQVPDANQFFFLDPGLTHLDDGTLLLAAPQWRRPISEEGRCLRILRSENGGLMWEEMPTLPFEEGTPFVLDGQLLMFVQTKTHHDFKIVSSDDAGRKRTPPRTVIEDSVWNISTSQVTRSDKLFWAMDYDLPNRRYGGKVMARLDRDRSPLDPDAWSLSNIVPQPKLPGSLSRGLSPQRSGWSGNSLVWLEPNTVDVAGRIRIFVRCVIDEQAIAHTAGVLDYDPEVDLLSFTQFTSWPGAQCKFFVVHDSPQGKYWMLINLVTNSQELLGMKNLGGVTAYRGSPANERRWLFMHYIIDCLNWFPADCVARWPDRVDRSFMYPSAVIDGEDMVVLSRTSRDSGDEHDAYLCTVHRIRSFRHLAMDLHKGGLHV